MKGRINSWSVEYDRSEEMTGAELVTESLRMENSENARKRLDIFGWKQVLTQE